ncbi:MAG: sigma-70 family RNA polymerase sigma factor [Planctomycetota bacterium]|nr:sigma-70 family RNA polymerase sigma factor [Planctomycetota bacterium]
MEPFRGFGVLRVTHSLTPESNALVAIAKNSGSRSSIITLVRAAQAGDAGSFATLYLHYQQSVERTLQTHLINASDISDVRQEVTVQAAASLNRLRNPECIGSWLRTIARRLAARRNARLARDRSVDPHSRSGNPICRDLSPIERLIAQEEYEAVHAAVNSLKPRERQVLKWFYFEGRSLRQISQLAQIPVGTVKSRLHHARRRLGVRLRRLLAA